MGAAFVLMASVPVLRLVEEMQREGMSLQLIGEWNGVEKAAGPAVERFDSVSRWDGVGVLVHFSPWGVVSPLLGEAIDAGVAVISPQHPTDDFAGSLAKLLVPDVEYASFAAAVFRIAQGALER